MWQLSLQILSRFLHEIFLLYQAMELSSQVLDGSVDEKSLKVKTNDLINL